MSRKFHYDFPIGKMCVEIEEEYLAGLYMDSIIEEDEQETSLHKEVHKQLQEYFQKKRSSFDLPIKVAGTDFQMQVWDALCKIPYGETRSYVEIARMIDNPKVYRPVGGANKKNPIMIVIPCHRVINADGSLGGFGCGVEVKQYLLQLENEAKIKKSYKS